MFYRSKKPSHAAIDDMMEAKNTLNSQSSLPSGREMKSSEGGALNLSIAAGQELQSQAKETSSRVPHSRT